MAHKIEDAGSKKLGVHIEDEPYNVWTREQDEELPDPASLKRGPRVVRRDYHRGVRLNVWISPAEKKRVERLRMKRGLSFQEWFRRCIDLDEKERPSEASQYVRRIVPEQFAILAERALCLMGEVKFADAIRQTDWEVKKALKEEAGFYMDAAAWATDVRKEWELLTRKADLS